MLTPLKWEKIESLINENDSNDAFYVADLDQLRFLYDKWIELLPRVTPFYAVKCNPDPDLLKHLSKFEKIGFDCASMSEMSKILGENVSCDKIIYSNPNREIKHLTFASKNNIKLLSFDSESELVKIRKYIPDAELVLRIIVKEMNSLYSFKDKYGVSFEDSKKLLKIAAKMNMNVVGVCFHVGCSATNPQAYYYAIEDCRKVFDYAKNKLDLDLKLLNIGGGYSSCFEGSSDLGLPFERAASLVNAALDKYFPIDAFPEEKLKIIAEPGRYLCQRVYSLVVNIFNKKKYRGCQQLMSCDEETECDRIMYYVNQGIYSGFNCVLFDHKAPLPRAFYTKGNFIEYKADMSNSINSTVWGQTCDGGDWIFTSLQLPELDMGDWIVFDNAGAYTLSITSTFNGFEPIKIHWLD